MAIFNRRGLTSPVTFMGRLGRDRRGNTLAMMAAMLIPLSAMAGSGVDTARMYFVKVRLQQACDAGALAGRKFMTGTTYGADANIRANSFFDNNFRAGVFGTTSTSRTFIKTVDNQVHGEASAVVPMTVMKMFGTDDTTIAVSCEAKLEIPNLDVMFVLDTTGSMGDTNPGDSVSKISALRSSVGSFYDTLEASKTGSSQIRYGFVPYSSTVNVGLLLKRDWMVDSWNYQSREPDPVPTTSTSVSTQGAWNTSNGPQTITGTITTTTSYGNPESCAAPANTRTSSTAGTTGYTNNPDGSRYRTVVTTYTGPIYSSSLSNGVCTITKNDYNNYKVQYTETQTPNPNSGQQTTTTSNVYWWNYKRVTFDVSNFKGTLATGLMAGGRITTTLNGGGSSSFSTRNIDWNASSACIEERDTVRATDYATIPSDAYDLDVDTVPTVGDPRTQWRPSVPALIYARSYTSYSADPTVSTSGWPANITTPVHTTSNYVNMTSYPNDYAACPTSAKKLGSITKSALTTYMNSLKVAGRTYHDIGFLWGLRLLSAEGLYASENTTAPNSSPIARHVIFMTDGQTETNFGDYDAYGLAALDRRRTDLSRLPTNSEQNGIVENRLTALCKVAQRKNMTVWVIAFGTTLTPLLSGCATPGNHAFQANNATELNNAFSSIASQIAKLRVSK